MIHHDLNHSFLFDHPEMVESLIKTFIHDPWVRTIRWETLTKEDTKLQGATIEGELLRKRADRLWSAYREDGSICLFIFLEFQSTVVYVMAARLLLYVALGYDILLRSGRATGSKPLPAVIPLVLYNGARPWSAPHELKELINLEEGHPLWRWQPSLEYPVVIERSIGRACLVKTDDDTLLKLIFAVDSVREPGELRALLPRLSAILETTDQRLRESTLIWLKNCAASVFVETHTEITKGQEVTSMLAQTIKRWEAEFQENSRVMRQEGRQEGLLEGLRVSLQSIVSTRFGEGAWGTMETRVSAIDDASVLRGLITKAAVAERVGDIV